MNHLKQALFPLYDLYLSRKDVYRNYEGPVPFHQIDSRVSISLSHKFVYFRIPKAANSTVIASLYFAETGMKPTALEEMHMMKRSYKRPGLLNQRQSKEIDSFFKFSMVRNPYNRFISAYADKIIRGKSGKSKVSRFLGKNINDDISVDEFLSYLEQGGAEKDGHWALQSDLMLVPAKSLDYIGKVENIKTDLPKILNTIFGKSEIVNWRPHASKKLKTRVEMDQRTQNRVYKLYEKDFDLFEYEREFGN